MGSHPNESDAAIIDEMRGYNTIEEELSYPYKKGNLWSQLKYYGKSIIVTNPRLFSLYLLYKSIWPRALVIVDLWTDIIVCLQLYFKNEIELFSLSLLFLSFPFVITWVTSLRFIQKFFGDLANSNSGGKCSKKLLNLALIFYLFPPFGCIIITLYEVGWVFYDIYHGLKSFLKNEILIIDKNSEISSIKQFRRVIEFFGESVPQTGIQLYIWSNLENINISQTDLYTSLAVSLFTLIYNMYKLKTEAKFHCMSFATYAISVLQLGEIPIVKLVPRLPGIRRGVIDYVNFSDFKIDKESLGPIIEALSDPMCHLKKIKVKTNICCTVLVLY